MLKTLVLFALALAASPSSQDFSGAPIAKVTLADYKFVPSTVRLPAGKPVILRLVNAAEQPHEFAAPEFFRNSAIRPSDAKFINKEGEAEVPASKQVEIALTPKAGTYHLQCNKPGHAMLGMEGTIVVK